MWLLGSIYALSMMDLDVFLFLTAPGSVINRVFSLHGLSISLKDRCLVIVPVTFPRTYVYRLTVDLP